MVRTCSERNMVLSTSLPESTASVEGTGSCNVKKNVKLCMPRRVKLHIWLSYTTARLDSQVLTTSNKKRIHDDMRDR